MLLIAGSYGHLAISTRYERAKALRRMLQLLREEHGAPKLKDKVPRVTRPAPRNITATIDERALMLAHATPWVRCWLLLCSDLAIRSGTAARIAPIHYDSARQEVTFRTKYENAQTLPVTGALAAIFDATTGDPSKPYVELLRGRPICQIVLLHEFKKLRQRLGMQKRITPHDLRRTTAVQTLELTRDLRFVQALLGHQSLASTFHYLDHRNTPVSRETLELAKLNERKQP